MGYAVQRLPFKCARWEPGTSFADRGGVRTEIFAGPYSPAFDKLCDVVAVDSTQQLKRTRCDGKLVVLRGKLAAVNLIPLNPVPESGLQRSTPERIERFEDMLKVRRITVTVRKEMGADIEAACGQLRQRTGKGGVR